MNSVQVKPQKLTETETAPELSLFLPVLDEEENLRPMHAKIQEALASLGKTAEVIYVDDGSTDASLEILKEIAASDVRVRVISLRRNYGQTAAMSAGIESPIGEPLATFPPSVPALQMGGDAKRRAISLSSGYSDSSIANASVRLTAAPMST